MVKTPLTFSIFGIQIAKTLLLNVIYIKNTGVARNFDWGGPKIEKFCYVILMTFFGHVMAITLLK